MKKRLKYISVSLLIFTTIFLIIWASIPFFLKSSLKESLDKEFKEQLKGKFSYEDDDLDILMFRHFPYIGVSLENFSITGEKGFARDTLIKGEKVDIIINPWTLVLGDNPNLRGVVLSNLDIYLHRLGNGEANWDVLPVDWEEEGEKKEEKSKKGKASMFPDGLSFWRIENTNIVLEDEYLGLFLELKNINQESKIKVFSKNETLKANLFIQKIQYKYQGVNYYKDSYANAAIDINFDRVNRKYTLKTGDFRFNELQNKITGTWQEKESALVFDMKYASQGKDLEKLVSIFPNISAKYLKALDIKGTFAFGGYLKGTYLPEKKLYPTFNTFLKVEKGFLQFPQLPKAFDDCNIDFSFTQKGTGLENISIKLKEFQLKIGEYPVNAQAFVEHLKNGKIDAWAKTDINLDVLNDVLPLAFINVGGKYNLDAKIEGKYSDNGLPKMDVKSNLEDGYLKVILFPNPLKNVDFIAEINNETGKFEDFKCDISKFQWQIVEDIFSVQASLKNWKTGNYELLAQGNIDFHNLLKSIPTIWRMYGRGNINTDIKITGQVWGEKPFYKNEGFISLSDFKYEDRELPQSIRVIESTIRLENQGGFLENFLGFAGESKIEMKGNFNRVIPYFLDLSKNWEASLDIKSNKFDLNEWIEKEEKSREILSTTVSLKTPENKQATDNSVPETKAFNIPQNIDFQLNINIDTLIYKENKFAQVQLNTHLKDAKLKVSDFSLGAFGGFIKLLGEFAIEKEIPYFEVKLGLEKIQAELLKEAFPELKKEQIIESFKSSISTKIDLKGKLNNKNEIVLDKSLEGNVFINLEDVFLENPFYKDLPTLMKRKEFEKIKSENIAIQAYTDPKRGLLIRPFQIKTPYYNIELRGEHSFEKILDVDIILDLFPIKEGEAHLYTVLKISGKADKPSFDIKSVGSEKPTFLLK